MDTTFEAQRSILDKIQIISNPVEYQNFLEELVSISKTKPVRLGFVNAHAFNMVSRNQDFLRDLLSCDYLLRDGIGVKMLFRVMGRNPGMNMNGTDFIPEVLKKYSKKTLFLMGTTTPYLENAAEEIKKRDIDTIYILNGFHESAVYKAQFKEKSPDITVLGMGMPKQEKIASDLASIGHASLIICGGAILDFMGRKIKRAPNIVRRTGMEWFYRLLQEPKRLFRRYMLGNIEFLARILVLRFQKQNHFELPKNIKILHVVRQFYPGIGGLETYVMNMAAYQKVMGYDCTVLTLNQIFHGGRNTLQEYEEINGIKIKRVSFWGVRRFFVPLVPPSFFSKFDIVHVHNTDVFYDYVALISPFIKAKYFATTHGGFFHTKDYSLAKKIYFNTMTRLSSAFYKNIFAISRNDFDKFSEISNKVTLLHNAAESISKDISKGNDFIFIGRLAANKHVDRIIDAFSEMIKRHQVHGNLHIVGPSWDVSIEILVQRAKDRGAAHRIKFYGGTTSQKVKEIVSQCGYFLSASSYEGFGMSMLEAMSAGLIPYVQPNEAFKELVQNAGVGMLIDYKDSVAAAEQISQNILSILPHDRKVAQDYAAKFSWQELVQKTDEYYRSVNI